MRQIRTFIILIICISLSLTTVGCEIHAEPRSSGTVETNLLTCRQAAELLCKNAAKYADPAPAVSQILQEIDPDAKVTNLTGCRMIFNAFGELPEADNLTGIRYLIKYTDCDFTDVPAEGTAAVDNLVNAGLYIPEDNTLFEPNKAMSEKQLLLLIDRIHAYLQNSPVDDYYSYVNKDLLNDENFFPFNRNTIDLSIATDGDDIVDAWLHDMLALANTEEYADNEYLQNAAAFYSTYEDMEGRKNSMKFFQPYLDAIWNTKNFDELAEICSEISVEFGTEILLSQEYYGHAYLYNFSVNENYIINGVYINTGIHMGFLDKESFTWRASLEQNTKLLTVLGFEQEEAHQLVLEALDYRHTVAQAYQDLGTGRQGACITDIDSGGFNLEGYFVDAGFANPEHVFVTDARAAEIRINSFQQPKFLNAAKFLSVQRLLEQFSFALPSDVCDAVLGFYDSYYAAYPEEYFSLNNLVWNALLEISPDICMYYKETDELAKLEEKINGYINDICKQYKRMFANATWLSDTTAQKALEKLDAMGVEVLIPRDSSAMPAVDFKSRSEGGTLVENYKSFFREMRRWYCEQDGKKYTKQHVWMECIQHWWQDSAFYGSLTNSMFIPIGTVLRNMSEGVSEAEMLATVGFLIAHEISHAFDNHGAFYDSEGKRNNWWVPEDLDRFNIRCQSLVDYYDGYECLPGYAADGKRTLGENIADITAMKCVLQIAADMKDFDYDTFFEAIALMFVFSTTRLGYEGLLANEPHSLGRVRVNRMLSLFDEFYDTTGAAEGDFMYVAPQDRPKVW